MLTVELRGQSKHILQVEENSCMCDVKKSISSLENVPAAEILLYSCGAPLTDEMMVSQLSSLTIDLCVPLLGGKVHGSLARAGKVKGQTPKVEKQDKKKRKTGRAKRRMQYNRRFVNVVPTFGRRKGPNANS